MLLCIFLYCLCDLLLDSDVRLHGLFMLQVLVNYARSSKEAEEVSKEVENCIMKFCDYLYVQCCR